MEKDVENDMEKDMEAVESPPMRALKIASRRWSLALAAAALCSVVMTAQQKIYWGNEVPSGWRGQWPAELQTIPERTSFTRTMTSEQLLEYIAALKSKSETVHVVEHVHQPDAQGRAGDRARAIRA